MPGDAPISLIASDGFYPVADFIPPPAVADVVTPGMSVTDALGAMEQANAGPESIELLSKSMDQQKLLEWGVESGKLAEGNLPAADLEALKAADSIVSEGGALTAASGEQASAAAAASGFAGPGAFMAQAIAMAAPTAVVGAAAMAGAPLAGAAVGAATPVVATTVKDSVLLSAAAKAQPLPEPTDTSKLKTIEDPSELEAAQEQAKQLQEQFDQADLPPPEEQFEAYKPFIDLGKQIAGA